MSAVPEQKLAQITGKRECPVAEQQEYEKVS